jgi:DNA helicase-2/ATP-dependent DNA helicase PcrA
VIALRVAQLLKNGCRPSNIIAFTFTEKAAAELKERIRSRCREELGQINGLAEMYVGTIHAFCLDLLTVEVSKYLKFAFVHLAPVFIPATVKPQLFWAWPR